MRMFLLFVAAPLWNQVASYYVPENLDLETLSLHENLEERLDFSRIQSNLLKIQDGGEDLHHSRLQRLANGEVINFDEDSECRLGLHWIVKKLGPESEIGKLAVEFKTYDLDEVQDVQSEDFQNFLRRFYNAVRDYEG